MTKAMLIAEVTEKETEIEALRTQVMALRSYLISDKFSEDQSVNVRDVLYRLEGI